MAKIMTKTWNNVAMRTDVTKIIKMVMIMMRRLRMMSLKRTEMPYYKINKAVK
jgi:hypothetical protein